MPIEHLTDHPGIPKQPIEQMCCTQVRSDHHVILKLSKNLFRLLYGVSIQIISILWFIYKVIVIVLTTQ